MSAAIPAAKGQVLLIVTGGIAACKAPDLIRRLRERDFRVRCVMTKGAHNFVTATTLAALSGEQVEDDLFERHGDMPIRHLALAQESDIILVAPATAHFLAKMAHGQADDLATTLLLATRAPVLVAPAMNPVMWEHPATQRTIARLKQDGIQILGPAYGAMAEAVTGWGRMVEPSEIVSQVERSLTYSSLLSGHHVLVTAGPTHEPLDPVRFLGNRSSGKQGYAIAAAAQALGARVTLISGPVSLTAPFAVDVVRVETAEEMKKAVEQALPADIAIFAAAVSDWKPAAIASTKLKKGRAPESLALSENPDILAFVSRHATQRPVLVAGFAAETNAVLEEASRKRERKGCDFIFANDVSKDVFGSDYNLVHLVSSAGVETWPVMLKTELASRMMHYLAEKLVSLPLQAKG
jgi:phosphopantothenoylcysteine decarboxylase / phosphopantothenate---cysteine ligase